MYNEETMRAMLHKLDTVTVPDLTARIEALEAAGQKKSKKAKSEEGSDLGSSEEVSGEKRGFLSGLLGGGSKKADE